MSSFLRFLDGSFLSEVLEEKEVLKSLGLLHALGLPHALGIIITYTPKIIGHTP